MAWPAPAPRSPGGRHGTRGGAWLWGKLCLSSLLQNNLASQSFPCHFPLADSRWPPPSVTLSDVCFCCLPQISSNGVQDRNVFSSAVTIFLWSQDTWTAMATQEHETWKLPHTRRMPCSMVGTVSTRWHEQQRIRGAYE